MDTIVSRIQELGDLELAVLLSLVAQQHCIITGKTDLLDNLAQELRLIATRIFSLSCAVLNCSASTTLDDFREGVLVDAPCDPDQYADSQHQSQFLSPSIQPTPSQSLFRNGSSMSNPLDERKVANVIIAKDLNLASHNVQTQALELIRTRRLYSHTAMHGASKDFIIIALQASGSRTLTRHLNDLFAISHHHSPEDGFPNLEELSVGLAAFNDAASTSSVVHRRSSTISSMSTTPKFSRADIKHLRVAASEVRITAEVATYLHNISLFLRLSRHVAGGVSALATSHFRTIVSALAPLHDLTYCPPSLVALAARKIYPHRLVLATAKTEISLQWGSDPKAVQEMLEGMTAEDAIEAVLSSVEAPL